jgi:hypothetical protein
MEGIEVVKLMIKSASDIALDFAKIKGYLYAISGKQELPTIVESQGPQVSNQPYYYSLPKPISESPAGSAFDQQQSLERKVSTQLDLTKMNFQTENNKPAIDVNAIQNAPPNSPEGLLKYMLTKKKAKLSDISKDLGVPKDVIEKWATVLSEEGLLKISYPFFGEPTISV